jgi:NAD(P)H-flavin reductase
MIPPLDCCEAEIIGVKRQTRDTVTLTISPSRADVLDYDPGQFNMVGLRGVGEVPISVSSAPGMNRTLDHTIRDVGSVTGVLCALKQGDRVDVRGPYGNGWPIEETRGRDLVIVGGGIGLAPLRGVICEVVARRGDYGRVDIVYGARTPDDLLFTDEFSGWAESKDTKLLLSVDRVPDRSEWKQKVGVVLALFDDLGTDPYKSVVFTCGPEIMMRFVVRGLIHRGYPPETIYVSMERRMKCGIGHCGHCQLGPKYVCLDGPVMRYVDVKDHPDSMI